MDDKKVVNTQHVKYIETLSRIQNVSLLNQLNCSVDGAVENTGLASDTADIPEPPRHDVVEPVKPTVAEPVERILTRTATSPSHLVASVTFYPLS
jgi:hypothetical protein